MTISQILSFLEVARCKNISEAAKHLYTTQPALGRQLTALETELNMQLMIRSNRGIKLTPAGMALQEEFEQMMEHYKNGISNAERATKGYSGTLSIGVLEELNVMEEIAAIIDYFEQNYPNVNVRIMRRSFGGLLDGLYSGKIDAAISLDVNFYENNDVDLYNIKTFQPAFAVPINHPLAKKESLDFADFKDVPLVIVEKDDCQSGVEFLRKVCRDKGGFYPDLYFTTSQKDAVFWVESGKKCAVLNTSMSIAESKRVKMFPINYDKDVYIQLATKSGNHNFTLHLLKEILLK